MPTDMPIITDSGVCVYINMCVYTHTHTHTHTHMQCIKSESLCIHREMAPRSPKIPKFMNAQVPYMKWHGTVGPL